MITHPIWKRAWETMQPYILNFEPQPFFEGIFMHPHHERIPMKAFTYLFQRKHVLSIIWLGKMVQTSEYPNYYCNVDVNIYSSLRQALPIHITDSLPIWCFMTSYVNSSRTTCMVMQLPIWCKVVWWLQRAWSTSVFILSTQVTWFSRLIFGCQRYF